MDIVELSSDIKLYLQERVSNPFWTPFIMSWLIWNHRFVVVLISDRPVQEKFSIIDTSLYPASEFWSLFWGKALLFPLATSLSITLLLPFVLRWLYLAHGAHQNANKAVQNKIEGETPLTEKDRTELLLKLHKQESEYKEKIIDLTKERDDLNGMIETLTNNGKESSEEEQEDEDKEVSSYDDFFDPIKNLKPEDKEVCLKLLGTLARSSNNLMHINTAARENNLTLQQATFFTEVLVDGKLVNLGNEYISLKPKGRKYLYDKELL